MTDQLRVSPETYARVFEADPLGRQILDDLVLRFHDCSLFDKENMHNTAFKLGQRDVVGFILRRLAQVNADPEGN